MEIGVLTQPSVIRLFHSYRESLSADTPWQMWQNLVKTACLKGPNIQYYGVHYMFAYLKNVGELSSEWELMV